MPLHHGFTTVLETLGNERRAVFSSISDACIGRRRAGPRLRHVGPRPRRAAGERRARRRPLRRARVRCRRQHLADGRRDRDGPHTVSRPGPPDGRCRSGARRAREGLPGFGFPDCVRRCARAAGQRRRGHAQGARRPCRAPQRDRFALLLSGLHSRARDRVRRRPCAELQHRAARTGRCEPQRRAACAAGAAPGAHAGHGRDRAEGQ